MNRPACFFASELGWDTPCGYRPDGKADRCHLIPKQRLVREGFRDEVWNPLVWVYGCRKHHGTFDGLWAGVLPLEKYPPTVRSWAREHGWFFVGGRGWLHAVELTPPNPDIARPGEW